MIPATLPVMANVASVVTALLALGRRIHERGAYLGNATINPYPRGESEPVINRRNWQPVTMTERMRDYLSSTNRPEFSRITEDMHIY